MSRRGRNHYQRKHRVAAWYERRLHARMDLLLANSNAVAEDLRAEGAPPERIRLIYNGIDASRFTEGSARDKQRVVMRRELSIPEDGIVLCCVANLFHYKGHADLLVALAALGEAFTRRGLLLLAGRDAGMLSSLRAQADALGLSSHVRFLGERDDTPAILAASDIGVLASHEEGFSNAVLEGMAAGLPMVVTDVGGNAEAVLDGECGYVVPVSQPQAFAGALAKLLETPSLGKAMGEAGRKRVCTSFSLESCVAAYEALYEEVWSLRQNQHRWNC